MHIKLQDLIEKHGKPSPEAFQSVCDKEKPGRFRCHGRTTTPTLLKKNAEIAKLRREHTDEVKRLKDQIQEMEKKRHKEAEAIIHFFSFMKGLSICKEVQDHHTSGRGEQNCYIIPIMATHIDNPGIESYNFPFYSFYSLELVCFLAILCCAAPLTTCPSPYLCCGLRALLR